MVLVTAYSRIVIYWSIWLSECVTELCSWGWSYRSDASTERVSKLRTTENLLSEKFIRRYLNDIVFYVVFDSKMVLKTTSFWHSTSERRWISGECLITFRFRDHFSFDDVAIPFRHRSRNFSLRCAPGGRWRVLSTPTNPTRRLSQSSMYYITMLTNAGRKQWFGVLLAEVHVMKQVVRVRGLEYVWGKELLNDAKRVSVTQILKPRL